MKVSVEYAFVIEKLCSLCHGHWFSSHANCCPSTCSDIFFEFVAEGEGVGYTELFATDGFSPLSDICDSLVVSGGGFVWF